MAHRSLANALHAFLKQSVVALLLVGLGGCSTKQDTGKVLTAAGITAVVVAASVSDDDCDRLRNRDTAEPMLCERAGDEEKKAAALLAAAGTTAALIGTQMQRQGPDSTRPVRTSPPSVKKGGPGPWRLVREPAPDEEKEQEEPCESESTQRSRHCPGLRLPEHPSWPSAAQP